MIGPMTKRLYSFLRGMGSVLEIAPAPERELLIQPLYERPDSDEAAIQGYWWEVGSYLQQAMDSVDREQAAQEESA